MACGVGRTRTLLASMFVIASVALLACFTATAAASEVHVFSKDFGKGELSLAAHSGIAVDQGLGEVYVADTNNERIAKFTGNGTPDGSIGGITSPTFIAIDNSLGSEGDIYVSEGEDMISKRDPSGALVTAWGDGGRMTVTEELLGIAVDPGGNLWVLCGEGESITGKEFDEAGAPLRSWIASSGGFTRNLPWGTTVNSSDVLTVFTEYSPSEVIRNPRRFGPDGIELKSLPSSAVTVAADPATDDFYIGRLEGAKSPPYLVRLSPELEELERFGGANEGTADEVSPVVDQLKEIGSLAVAETGPVYALDSIDGKVAMYVLEEVVPPTVLIEPPDDVTQTSAHVVGHVDLGVPTGSAPSHDVQWEFRCTPKCPGHSGYIKAAQDGSKQTVEATLTDLEPGTEYTLLLYAENRGGSAETGVEEFSTAPAAPEAITKSPSEVARGEAILHGTVNSNGSATTYRFDYTTRAAFKTDGFAGGASTAEYGPLPAPAVPRQVAARIDGLQAGVEYVYRVVATNLLGTKEGDPVEFRAQVGPNSFQPDCPNQSLRTGAGAGLPDCRAYEMVSPVDKNGNLVEPFSFGLQAALDGSGVTWFTGQSATGIPSSQGGHQGYAFYLSTLAGESWTSQRLLAPQALGGLSSLVGLTGDERYALIETAAHVVKNGAGETKQYEPALYLLDTASHALTTVVPPRAGQEEGRRTFALDGASSDDSLIFFESHLQLTPSAAPQRNNLYVWNRESGALSLAGVLPGAKGEAPPGGSFGGAYSWWLGQPRPDTGGAEEALYVEAVHAISESGDAVYFTAGETAQIYVRHGLTGPKPTTVRVSVANAGVNDSNGQKPAAFQEATPDGSKAFFLSSGRLTQNANTGSSDQGSDLYRYDAAAKTPLVDVSPLPGGLGARVKGLLGASEDGRSGYLVAEGVLAAEGDAVEGDSNVYHFEEEGGTFAYTFVANLGPTSGALQERNWSPTAEYSKTARVSEDGGTVLFMSHKALTGLPEGGCIVQGSCMQVYRYSMSEGSLACLSCNPTGEGAPRFGAELGLESEGSLVPENHIKLTGTSAIGNAISGILPANLSASGDRAFFQSSEGLLPEDVNGAEPTKSCGSPYTCVDVYEWEAVGTGSCRAPNQAGGCLYLLSTGESRQSSFFINSSADGSSAFILTSSSLVPADQDDLTDVYDARVDGGLAAQHADPSEPCRSSEACKGPVSASQPTTPAGTSSFQGPGNPPRIPPCKKGFIRKHGKCVKKPKKGHKKKHHTENKKKHHTENNKKRRSTGQKHSGGAK